MIGGRVAAGDAPPSLLGKIADAETRAHIAQEAARRAAARGDAALTQELLSAARASALTADPSARDGCLASLVSDEIELQFLERAEQTTRRIKHKGTRAEKLALLAAAYIARSDVARGEALFAEALPFARKAPNISMPNVVMSPATSTVIAYMIDAGRLDLTGAAIRELPEGSERDELLRHLAVAHAASHSPEQAFAIVLEITNPRTQIAAYLDIADQDSREAK
jgi:hypothetical protein